MAGLKVSLIAPVGDELATGLSSTGTVSGDDVDWDTAAATPGPIDSLLDVNAPTPADGDVLTWDTGTSTWIAAAPAAGDPGTGGGAGGSLYLYLNFR